jgi:hypothetical protein
MHNINLQNNDLLKIQSLLAMHAKFTQHPKGDPMRTRAQLRQLQRSCPRAKHPSPQRRPDAHACPVASAAVLLPARKAPISSKETRCARVPSCVSYSAPGLFGAVTLKEWKIR